MDLGRYGHSIPGSEGGAGGSLGVCLEARRLADGGRAAAGAPVSGWATSVVSP